MTDGRTTTAETDKNHEVKSPSISNDGADDVIRRSKRASGRRRFILQLLFDAAKKLHHFLLNSVRMRIPTFGSWRRRRRGSSLRSRGPTRPTPAAFGQPKQDSPK